jgi:predicted transporter
METYVQSIIAAIVFLFFSILNFVVGATFKKKKENDTLANFNIVAGVVCLIVSMLFGGFAYIESRPVAPAPVNNLPINNNGPGNKKSM